MLDEPTNDLDLETLDLLEELLMEYSGTLLLVSHDRAFLDNVVTSTLVLEDDGAVTESVGGYDDRMARRRQGASSEPEQKPPEKGNGRPKRPGPRKLSYKEGRELDELPGRIRNAEERIAALEAERDELHRILSDPKFYKEDAGRIAGTKSLLETMETEIASEWRRWEALEEALRALSAIGRPPLP